MIAATTPAVKLVTICGHTAPAPTWRRALERAHAEGVKVYRTLAGDWQATSVSHPGVRHLVRDYCDCPGAAGGYVCKHLAAVRSAQARLGLLTRCEACGRVGPTERMIWGRRHVGGQPDAIEWYCGPGYGHQANWPAE